MKITLLSTGLQVGGAEKQVCSLAEYYASVGNDVQLISMTGDAIIKPSHSKIEIVELKAKKTLLGLAAAYLMAREKIKKFSPDVVHSHMVHANIFSRVLRLTVNIPKLICTAHSSNEGGCVRMFAYRLTDRLCDLTTNVGEEAKRISISRGAVPAHRIIAMYNGIDTKYFTYSHSVREKLRRELGISEDVELLLAVGRLTAAKDYPNLLSAFSIVNKIKRNTQLIIIGAGEEDKSLNVLTKSLGISSKVHFLGLRHDVNEWMCAADLYVMSSAWEGIPLVLLEAMSCELTVVATDCGGVKEILNGFGYLSPPQNPQALAESILAGLSLDADEKQKKLILARNYVEDKFSLPSIANRWLDIYK
ncbi:putative teichuronic acid biosynthesis glycosyltransferase TuaC [compost metagenome]